MFEDKKDCKRRGCCIDITIFVLSILLTFTLGIIIGATTGIFDALGVGAFVVLAILIGLFIIVKIMTLICCKDKKDKCC